MITYSEIPFNVETDYKMRAFLAFDLANTQPDTDKVLRLNLKQDFCSLKFRYETRLQLL